MCINYIFSLCLELIGSSRAVSSESNCQLRISQWCLPIVSLTKNSGDNVRKVIFTLWTREKKTLAPQTRDPWIVIIVLFICRVKEPYNQKLCFSVGYVGETEANLAHLSSRSSALLVASEMEKGSQTFILFRISAISTFNQKTQLSYISITWTNFNHHWCANVFMIPILKKHKIYKKWTISFDDFGRFNVKC